MSKEKLKNEIQSLLNKVNRVTCPHRHGQKIPRKDLDDLSNRQIDFGKFFENYKKEISEEDKLIKASHLLRNDINKLTEIRDSLPASKHKEKLAYIVARLEATCKRIYMEEKSK